MRLFKTSYTDKNGQRFEVKKWWIELRDHLQTVRRFPGLIDRRQTELLGRQIEKLVRCRASGDLLDPMLSRWLEQTPAKLRKHFAKIA